MPERLGEQKQERDVEAEKNKLMTFGFIEAEKASFRVTRMCRALGVSQSGFLARQERPPCRRQQQDMVYLAHIRTAFGLFGLAAVSPDIPAVAV